MNFLKNLFPDPATKDRKKLEPIVATINALEDSFASLSDEGLRMKTLELQGQLSAGKTTNDILPEAFALAREASKRTLGLRQFDVQMIGGIILNNGGIPEMRTGEGKTLVATAPVYLNALTGKGVHVVTVNDYLARRDAVWMGQVYNALGLSVAVINHDSSYLYDPSHVEEDKERDEVGSFRVVYDFLRPCSRSEAYGADITYGTNSEFGFDYLRDNISYDARELRQRGHHFAIVDEVDSILIDEARTPLIISAPAQESDEFYGQFAAIAAQLEPETHYTIDEKNKAIQLTDEGITRAEELLGVENIYTERGIKHVHHLETAVRAKALFLNNREYVVKNGEVIIVDEFTGRMQPGRRWSEGLHQAIEAKEHVSVQRESRTMASITYQNYFKLYDKLSGMTGTAETSAEEFEKIYNLRVIPVPPNKPSGRVDLNDHIFQTEKGKFMAIARRVKELHEKGQPVLIGTVSVEKNEELSAFLEKEGVPHTVLNAKNHEHEGEIVAQAGRKGAVTIATNMAGRGVDIKLGGNPSTNEQYEEIISLGGLAVIGTERHDARRIDNQLRGRSGRQGDPGLTQFFVSLEDSLMRIFATDTIKGMLGRFGVPEDEPIATSMITKALENAQNKIEGFNFDARKHVFQYDNVINVQRQAMYARRHKLLTGELLEVEKYFIDLCGEGGEAGELALRAAEQHIAATSAEQFYTMIRRLTLQVNDMHWVDHLEMMDYSRSSVNLRAYGQRDPLVEYKREALRMYRDMEAAIAGQILEIVPRLIIDNETDEQRKAREQKAAAQRAAIEKQMAAASAPTAGESGPAHVIKKKEQGRNDPCACGSGKKYKNCHGK
ncbi:MAG TPA: preprotein translocase subunit SecA [Candidatus Paceibacterota bacterium]|nr:preprotein translocase subunit SecA [Candidatus Paceibacterota bacterium]